MGSTDLDPGHRAQLRVTPDDHSAWIWLASLHSLAYAFCFLGFRLIVKHTRYAIDDVVLGVGYVSMLIESYNDYSTQGFC
jgi:hypothetical protein